MREIYNIVIGLVEEYGTRDPFELCECLGIDRLKSDLGNEIKGFFQRTPDGREIVHISSRLINAESYRVCAHELGHAVAHPEVSLSLFIENELQIKDKYEIEADKFTAELLIDIDITDPVYSGMNSEQLAALLGVPEKLVRYKFNMDR